MNNHNREDGSVNPLLISSIIAALFAAIFAGGFIWAFNNYQKYKNDAEVIIGKEVDKVREEAMTKAEQNFVEKEKEPYLQLVGPEDLGRVSISYPKTWSVYIPKSNNSGYEAYLNPVYVPAVSTTQPYAARIVITERNYDSVVASYGAAVKRGDLRSTPVTVNNFNGIRLDGKFSNTRSGSMVIFKVRDKTLTVATDVDSFRGDFDNILVKSLDFNP